MPLEHDPVKATANLKKHGVSADAEGVLFDPLALTVEDIGTVGERRLLTIGKRWRPTRRCLHLSRQRATIDFGSPRNAQRAKDL